MYNILFGRRKKFQLNKAESTYKVHYLGNVMTSLMKGGYHHGQLTNSKNKYQQSDIKISDNTQEKEINTNEDEEDTEWSLIAQQVTSNLNKKFNKIVCNVDKPVKILWDNHLKHNGHAGLKMKLTLTQGGLRVDTKDHGVTEYYGHRIHFIQSHPLHPKLFVWVYQHVGKNLKSEIRCHAALCQSARDARTIEILLNERLERTFLEYKREKRRQQNSRLCNSKNGGILTGQFGTRKRSFRSTKNYKPPVQHGMSSAPKLDDVIEEEEEYVEEREINDNLKSIAHSNESENEDTFIENDITETCAEEDDFDEEEEEEVEKICNTLEENEEENNEFINETIEKQPIPQLILSSSSASSSTSSPISSPLHSNLSSPSFNKPSQQQVSESTDLVTGSCISSSSSSASSASNSSDLINCSFDLEISQDDKSNLELTDLKLVDCKLNSNRKIFETVDENHKDFTEVSYDFLADLSKLNLANRISNSSNNYQLASLIDNPPPKEKSFYNPFRRTNISKSFSTFTTRLKQQQLKTQKNELKSKDTLFISEIKHKQNKSITTKCSNEIKTFSGSSSPLSSPDLSTSSSSSINSTTKNHNHLIHSLND